MEELNSFGSLEDAGKMDKEIPVKLGGYLGFDSTISTMTSLQEYSSGLSHNQFSPILGMDARVSEEMTRAFNKRKITENDTFRVAEAGEPGLGSYKVSSTPRAGVLDSEYNGLRDNERPYQSLEYEVKDGIRTLYRKEDGEKSNSSTSVALNTRRVLVNGFSAEVIPSLRVSKEARFDNIPSGFRDSNQLVEYYVGRVLRSSDSLFYIEKKLQQALYGAVFLAFELERELGDNPPYDRELCKPNLGEVRDRFKFDFRKDRVAIKVSSMSLRKRKPSLKENMEAEVIYSREMRCHKNVLEYSEIWQDSFKNIYVKMEFAEFEDLFEVMRRRKRPLTEGEARWLFKQIFFGVIELHKNNMAMRDLSLENILMYSREPKFFENFQESEFVGIIKPGDAFIVPKIADPGQACRIFPNKQDEISKLWKVYQKHPRDSGFQLQKVDFLFGKSFRPPEAYQTGSLYDPTKVDVFCLGWMLLYTLTKFQPFETCRLITEQDGSTKRNEGLFNNLITRIIANGHGNRTTEVNGKKYITKDENWSLVLNGKICDLFKKIRALHLSPEVLHLVENMLIPDFKERFSMQDVIQHPWLKGSSGENKKNFTPLMASTLSTIKPQKSSKIFKQSPNIVKPSAFFEKLNNDILEKVGPKTNSRKNSGGLGIEESANSKVEDTISKVNNDYLISMVKKTNERLKMTRVSISKKRDTEVEVLAKKLYSCSISTLPEMEVTMNPLPGGIQVPTSGASSRVDPIDIQTIKNLKGLNGIGLEAKTSSTGKIGLSSPSLQADNPQNSIQPISNRKRDPDSNFLLEIWSFFSGANNFRYSKDPNHISPS
ncbi:PIK3R4 kinase-related protein [Cryptosporidium felis]|nr:PIK3R4 kinase-related protein [Cryptosporidium felis]